MLLLLAFSVSFGCGGTQAPEVGAGDLVFEDEKLWSSGYGIDLAGYKVAGMPIGAAPVFWPGAKSLDLVYMGDSTEAPYVIGAKLLDPDPSLEMEKLLEDGFADNDYDTFARRSGDDRDEGDVRCVYEIRTGQRPLVDFPENVSVVLFSADAGPSVGLLLAARGTGGEDTLDKFVAELVEPLCGN